MGSIVNSALSTSAQFGLTWGRKRPSVTIVDTSENQEIMVPQRKSYWDYGVLGLFTFLLGIYSGNGCSAVKKENLNQKLAQTTYTNDSLTIANKKLRQAYTGIVAKTNSFLSEANTTVNGVSLAENLGAVGALVDAAGAGTLPTVELQQYALGAKPAIQTVKAVLSNLPPTPKPIEEVDGNIRLSVNEEIGKRPERNVGKNTENQPVQPNKGSKTKKQK